MPRDLDVSDLQLAVMRVLWNRGEASAADVQRALRRSRGLAITTISTLLQRLEKRGVVAHRAEGRGYVYRAAVGERDMRRSMLSRLVRGLFEGDASAVVTQLVSARDVKPDDLDRIQEALDRARRTRDAEAEP